MSHTAAAGRSPKLPGLTLFFLINLWIGVGLCLVGGLGAAYALFSDSGYAYFLGRTTLGVALLLCCIFAGYYTWVALSIHSRKREAPARCRVLAAISLGVAALALGWLFWFLLSFNPSMDTFLVLELAEVLPTIQNLMAGIVIAEAWRRYFAVSAKVRAAFGTNAYAGRLSPAPGEIGLFQVSCWLGIIYCGLEGLVRFAYFFSLDMAVNFTAMAAQLAAGIGGVVLPVIALAALGRRRGMRLAVLACLGAWLGEQILIYLVNIYEIFAEAAVYGSKPYGYPLLTVDSVIALAFWWYFYTSEKAAAWFNPAQPATVPAGQVA